MSVYGGRSEGQRGGDLAEQLKEHLNEGTDFESEEAAEPVVRDQLFETLSFHMGGTPRITAAQAAMPVDEQLQSALFPNITLNDDAALARRIGGNTLNGRSI